MDDNETLPMSDLEREFTNEQKGEGSLTLNLVKGGEKTSLGWDLHPENVEALYFEGIGVPRWETLKADTREQQTEMYWERFNERMDKYPLIGRARDTDEKVEYTADEVPELIKECEQITAGTTDAKALRAVQKISLAAARAADENAALHLTPSQLPDFG